MTKTESRRRKVAMPFDIRKKFAAAICMLLIATIMMVSSSYAWFTLSTAPEVKGITTSVGANGNLEIALLNWDSFTSTEPDLGILSNVGDSMANTTNHTVEQANATWGNLVDLSPTSYGLINIVLNPAALNITDVETDDKNIGSTILKAPTYGSDGRIIAVKTNTVTGEAVGNSFISSDEHAGVRAIGVSSGVTLRQSSYKNAVNAITSSINSAKNAASQSLVSNGGNLGGLLMKVAVTSNPTTVTFTREEVEYFAPMLDSLDATNEYVLTAIKQAALAYVLSAANDTDLEDDQVAELATAINAADADSLATAAGMTLHDSITAALTQYNATKTEISNARTTYRGLENKDNYTYAEISPLLNALIDKTYVSVAGNTNPGRDDVSDIIDAGNNIPIIMQAGSGVYSDIAKSVGSYSAGPITVPVNMSGLNLERNVTMTATAEEPILIPAAQTAIQTIGAYGGGTGAASISDTYGYAIDFGFRTNAANANLLLQQGGIQRIYDDNTVQNQATMGGGSYVQFTTSNVNTFSIDDMRALMRAIRIVFTTPLISENDVTYEIVAVAVPEIIEETNEGVTTLSGGIVSGNTIKVQLALYNYTAEPVEGTEDEVTVVLGAKKDTLELVELEQNKAMKLTAIVYLDGDAVDNSMVANAQTSMTGSLNLQFATDAELVPMENAALREGTSNGNETPTPTTPTLTYTQLTGAVTLIKMNSVYTAAVAADPKTVEQEALLDAVADAEDLESTASQEEIDAVVAALITACTNAGMTLPAALAG